MNINCKNILVYGYYHKSNYSNSSNLGDNLFAEAFKNIFPNYSFTFTSSLNKDNINKADAIFFGGGSFCYDKININEEDFKLLKTKKIFYIGVGIEKYIHPMHIECMRLAKLVATRTEAEVSRLQTINSNSIFLPDIVYGLNNLVKISQPTKSVLILPNILVVPQNNSAGWMHSSWNYFKSEFSQFLDYLVDNKYDINFFSMCNSNILNDKNAATEIINCMSKRNEYIINSSAETISELTELFSKYSVIITQRFHGIVLAEMAKTSYIAIHHHDKLKFAKPNNGAFLSYYGLYKQQLIDTFNSLNKISNNIDDNLFKNLQIQVDKLI